MQLLLYEFLLCAVFGVCVQALCMSFGFVLFFASALLCNIFSFKCICTFTDETSPL